MLAPLGSVSSEHVLTDGGGRHIQVRGKDSRQHQRFREQRRPPPDCRKAERCFQINLWIVFAEDDQATHQIDVSGPPLGYVISRSSTPFGAVAPEHDVSDLRTASGQ